MAMCLQNQSFYGCEDNETPSKAGHFPWVKEVTVIQPT